MINSKPEPAIKEHIVKQLRTQYEAEKLKHQPSGKLSAGILGRPILESVLHILGVPGKPVDDYALGLFRRGDSVEHEILNLLKPDETQVEVEYKNCIGYVDAIKDGEIYEVKSVKNSQVQYLDPENFKTRKGKDGKMRKVYDGPKRSHALQGGLYALALDKEKFTIIYASADDLQVIAHTIQTEEVKSEIESIIEKVYGALESHELPKWEAIEEWQTVSQYSSYPDWMTLSPTEAMSKLENIYPHCAERLKTWKRSAK